MKMNADWLSRVNPTPVHSVGLITDVRLELVAYGDEDPVGRLLSLDR
jgi:hypothetical protein